MGIFSPARDVLSMLFLPLKYIVEPIPRYSIFSFAYSLFFGSVGTLILQILVPKIILQAASDFKFFRNTRLYGGTENEIKN